MTPMGRTNMRKKGMTIPTTIMDARHCMTLIPNPLYELANLCNTNKWRPD